MFGSGREPHRHVHEQAMKNNKRKPRNVLGKIHEQRRLLTEETIIVSFVQSFLRGGGFQFLLSSYDCLENELKQQSKRGKLKQWIVDTGNTHNLKK